MPAFIKTKRDEELWDKAKGIAEESGHKEDWPYVTGIWKRMRSKEGSLYSKLVRLAHVKPALRPHLLSLLRSAASPSVASEVELQHMIVIDGDTLRPGTKFIVTDVEYGFTRLGPNPITDFLTVQSEDEKVYRIDARYFQYGRLPEPRDPLEEAFKYVQQALKAAGILSSLKRMNSTRRNGRRLELPYREQGKFKLSDVASALEKHPVIKRMGNKKFTLDVQTGTKSYQTFSVEIFTDTAADSIGPDPGFGYLEMYSV